VPEDSGRGVPVLGVIQRTTAPLPCLSGVPTEFEAGNPNKCLKVPQYWTVSETQRGGLETRSANQLAHCTGYSPLRFWLGLDWDNRSD
jgi:hypothetical protein